MAGKEVEADIADALDARHSDAGAAFCNRDIGAYSGLFSDNLRYEPANGKVIGKPQLMRNVEAQFRRIDRAESSFTREDLVVEGDQVTETLIQYAVCEASALGLIRRSWMLERRGSYSWTMEAGEWRIVHVRVLSEHLGSRWKIGS